MAVNDSDGRVAINLAGIGFGNVNNLLTGIVHEGGHGTYANSIIDEKTVGALTGSYIFDKNKNLVLSEDLSLKVLNDTAQYYADRGNGKLRDATGIIIASFGGTAGSAGGSKPYIAGATIFHEKYGIEVFAGEGKALTVNGTGVVSPSIGINAGIGLGLYPFTTKTEDYAGDGHSYYVQGSLKAIFLNISVSLPKWKEKLCIKMV